MTRILNLPLKYDEKKGLFALTASDDEQYRNLIEDISVDVLADLKLQAALFVRTRMEYASWTTSLFAPGGEEEIVKEDYMAFASSNGAYSSPLYFQMGEQYSRGVRYPTKAGFSVHLDDAIAGGLDRVQRGTIYAGEELAKKKDTILWTALSALVPGGQALTPSALDEDTWRTVVGTAEDNGYPITRAIMSKKRAMDTFEWSQPASWMWGPLSTSYGDQVMRNGYISTHLGIPIELQPNIPSNLVVFCGEPRERGRVAGPVRPMRTLQAPDIDNQIVRYAMHALDQYVIGDTSDVWALTIT